MKKYIIIKIIDWKSKKWIRNHVLRISIYEIEKKTWLTGGYKTLKVARRI